MQKQLEARLRMSPKNTESERQTCLDEYLVLILLLLVSLGFCHGYSSDNFGQNLRDKKVQRRQDSGNGYLLHIRGRSPSSRAYSTCLWVCKYPRTSVSSFKGSWWCGLCSHIQKGTPTCHLTVVSLWEVVFAMMSNIYFILYALL